MEGPRSHLEFLLRARLQGREATLTQGQDSQAKEPVFPLQRTSPTKTGSLPTPDNQSSPDSPHPQLQPVPPSANPQVPTDRLNNSNPLLRQEAPPIMPASNPHPSSTTPFKSQPLAPVPHPILAYTSLKASPSQARV